MWDCKYGGGGSSLWCGTVSMGEVEVPCGVGLQVWRRFPVVCVCKYGGGGGSLWCGAVFPRKALGTLLGYIAS